jgi:ribosomal protein L29
MADTKTTKKAAPKAEKTLVEQLFEKRNDLLEAKKSHAAGELINPRVLTTTRKDIARLLTKINAEKESK